MPTRVDAGRSPLGRPAAILAVIALILIAAVALFVAGSARRLPPPFGLAAPGDLVFVADGHIWTADPDGSRRIQLTFDDRTDLTPTYSRDGTKIAFKRLPAPNSVTNWEEWGDVIVADADGRNPIVIDRMIEAPSPITWSGDGRFIVYSKIVAGTDQVVVAATDGSSTRVITDRTRGELGSGTQPRRPHDRIRQGTSADHAASPRSTWTACTNARSPTSRSPARTASSGRPTAEPSSSAPATRTGSENLWVVGLDGRPEHLHRRRHQQRQLADLVPRRHAHRLPQSIAHAGIRVTVAKSDGSDAHPITDLGDWFSPQWSPDARHVLAVDGRQGGGQPIVAILDPSGHDPPSSFTVPDASGLGRADQSSWQRLAR